MVTVNEAVNVVQLKVSRGTEREIEIESNIFITEFQTEQGQNLATERRSFIKCL